MFETFVKHCVVSDHVLRNRWSTRMLFFSIVLFLLFLLNKISGKVWSEVNFVSILKRFHVCLQGKRFSVCPPQYLVLVHNMFQCLSSVLVYNMFQCLSSKWIMVRPRQDSVCPGGDFLTFVKILKVRVLTEERKSKQHSWLWHHDTGEIHYSINKVKQQTKTKYKTRHFISCESKKNRGVPLRHITRQTNTF